MRDKSLKKIIIKIIDFRATGVNSFVFVTKKCNFVVMGLFYSHDIFVCLFSLYRRISAK